MSELFQIECDIASSQLVKFTDVLNADCRLVWQMQSQQYELAGVVVNILQQSRRLSGQWHYRIMLAPLLWRSQLETRSCIYQHMTIIAILKQVLSRYQTHDYDVAGIQQVVEPTAHCTQYNESDWRFLQRICAQAGISYYWQLLQGRTILRFFDNNTSVGAVATVTLTTPLARYAGLYTNTASTLRYAPYENIPWTHITEQMKNADASYLLREQSPVVQDSNHEIIKQHCEATTSRSYFRQNYATVRLVDRLLLPGEKIQCATEPTTQWLVTRTEFFTNEHATPTIDCVVSPLTERYVAPVTFAKPIPILQTATVVGPKHDQIACDEYGRIKVVFAWDANKPTHERCHYWLRVASMWQGQTHSWQFLPRVGDEVIVDFMHGDIDHPVVLGSLTNAKQLSDVFKNNGTLISGLQRTTQHGQQHIVFDDRSTEPMLSCHSDGVMQLHANKQLAIQAQTSLALESKQGDVTIHVNQGDCTFQARQRIRFVVGGSSLEITPGEIVIQANRIHLN